MLFKERNVIVIVSAPSGCGKTTLCKELTGQLPGIFHSVSYTTRARRPGEISGRDYHFVSKAEFLKKIRNKFFAEWARYSDNYYGTPKRPVLEAIRNGRDVLLDIDVQGQKKLKKVFPGNVSIFILPPSFEELKKRLTKRRTDGKDMIKRRLAIAKRELSYIGNYDYAVVNNRIAPAVDAMRSIITAEKHKLTKRGVKR